MRMKMFIIVINKKKCSIDLRCIMEIARTAAGCEKQHLTRFFALRSRGAIKHFLLCYC